MFRAPLVFIVCSKENMDGATQDFAFAFQCFMLEYWDTEGWPESPRESPPVTHDSALLSELLDQLSKQDRTNRNGPWVSFSLCVSATWQSRAYNNLKTLQCDLHCFQEAHFTTVPPGISSISIFPALPCNRSCLTCLCRKLRSAQVRPCAPIINVFLDIYGTFAPQALQWCVPMQQGSRMCFLRANFGTFVAHNLLPLLPRLTKQEDIVLLNFGLHAYDNGTLHGYRHETGFGT